MSNPAIEHVFVLMLENRSFDHLLGKSGITGIDAETGQPTVLNGIAGAAPAAKVGPMDADPGHEFPDVVEQLTGTFLGDKTPLSNGTYPPLTGTGFESSFMRTAGTKANANPDEILSCFPPDKLPVLNALAREFAVCDSWYSSMPGPTLPNRFFLLAGSSGGLDHSPSNTEMLEELTIDGFPFQHGTIFDRKLRTRIYCGGILCMAQCMKGVNHWDVHRFSDFATDINSTDKPYDVQFTLIEPDYGDITGTFKGGTSQHPMDSVTGGEGLIQKVYETLRGSPIWEKSLLIVLWDEHGGFYDHVLPPRAVSPGDTAVAKNATQYAFDFSLYGIRVPSVIVSPLVPKNLVDHRVYDHTSVQATVEALFGELPFTARDAAARTVLPLLSLSAPRQTIPTLPDPAPADFTDAGSVDKSASANSGNVPAFIAAAMKAEMSFSPAAEREAILNKVKSIRTLAHADEYLKSVSASLDSGRGSGPSRQVAG